MEGLSWLNIMGESRTILEGISKEGKVKEQGSGRLFSQRDGLLCARFTLSLLTQKWAIAYGGTEYDRDNGGIYSQFTECNGALFLVLELSALSLPSAMDGAPAFLRNALHRLLLCEGWFADGGGMEERSLFDQPDHRD